MKKIITTFLMILFLASCGSNHYKLNEDNFFLIMTNMLYYPEQYKDSTIEYDAFMYDIYDTEDNLYHCSVRKCSSGYGCNCGKDTVIGFILNYDKELPASYNQSEDSVEKTWVHVKGKLHSYEFNTIEIYAYKDNEIDYTTKESIKFLTFDVEEISLISDYSNLKYYVTK